MPTRSSLLLDLVYSQTISALTLRYDRLLLQSKVSLPWLAVADLLHDENTDNVCRVDLENVYGEYEPSAKINVAMLCYLYGLPLFAASEDEPQQVVDVWTWHEICIVARKLGIAGLATQALEQLEMYFEQQTLVDEKTGLLHNKANVEWFIREVQLIRRCMDTNKRTDVIDMILRFCCQHYTELESNEGFQTLCRQLPDLQRDMLRYALDRRMTF
jgi:hypothetical protein